MIDDNGYIDAFERSQAGPTLEAIKALNRLNMEAPGLLAVLQSTRLFIPHTPKTLTDREIDVIWNAREVIQDSRNSARASAWKLRVKEAIA